MDENRQPEQMELLDSNVKDSETGKKYPVRPKEVPAKNTDATFSIFGWNFQIITAIVMSLKHIKELSEVIVEGKTEDIEIHFDGDKKPEYLQAKSVQKANKNRKDSGKLTLGLDTLINTSNRTMGEYSRLVFICNYDNPLAYDKHELPTFWKTDNKRIFERSYDLLTKEGQEYVDRHIKLAQKELRKHKYNDSLYYFDKKRLYIASHIFVTDDDKNMTLANNIGCLLYDCGIRSNTYVLTTEIINKLTTDYLNKAGKTNNDYRKKITKKELVWEILCPLLTVNCNIPNWIPDDVGDFLLMNDIFGSFFLKQCHDTDNINTILSGYFEFEKKTSNSNNLIYDFIINKWKDYTNIVHLHDVDENILKYGTQVIMYVVVKRKITINQIKGGTNLK